MSVTLKLFLTAITLHSMLSTNLLVKFQFYLLFHTRLESLLDHFDHEEETLTDVGSSHEAVCVFSKKKPREISVKLSLPDIGVIRMMKVTQEFLPYKTLQVTALFQITKTS